MRMYQGHRGAGHPESFEAAEDAEMPRMLEIPRAVKTLRAPETARGQYGARKNEEFGRIGDSGRTEVPEAALAPRL